MGFWDGINHALDGLFGNESTPPQAFPNSSSLGESDPYASALASAEAISPDQALPPISGPTPADPNDPFANNTAQLVKIQQQNSIPFTTIDINPYSSIGTRGYTGGASTGLFGPPTLNQSYAASQNTLKQISNLLNVASLGASTANLIAQGVYPIGATFPYQVTGNTVRIEQLSIGSSPNPSNVSTALIGNDVRGQQVLNLFLNGIFIQFESPDAPVFIARPGETYKLPFTKVYVTTFGAGNRWRLIVGSGQGTAIEGFSDTRTLRQQLHMWDGAGLFDNPMVHPIPITSGGNGNLGTASSLGGGVQRVLVSLESNQGGQFTNFDDGTMLSQRPNNQVVGAVVNNGYKILWITNLNFTIIDRSGSANTFDQLSLYKINAALGNYSASGAPTGSANSIYLNGQIIVPANGSVTLPIQYMIPKRVILAGFQTIGAAAGLISGESIFLTCTSKGNQAFTILVSIDGYQWPVLSPYCPYPMDPQALPTTQF